MTGQIKFNSEIDKDDSAFQPGFELCKSLKPDILVGKNLPAWYGWALRNAFWSGVNWGRDNDTLVKKVQK